VDGVERSTQGRYCRCIAFGRCKLKPLEHVLRAPVFSALQIEYEASAFSFNSHRPIPYSVVGA